MSGVDELGVTGVTGVTTNIFTDPTPAIVATLAIVIAAIAIGLGVALNSKRLKDFGKEEIFQVLITLALIGIFATLVQMMDSTVDMFQPYTNISCESDINTTNVTFHSSKTIDTALCVCDKMHQYLTMLSYNIIQAQFKLGYLSRLGMDFDVVYAEPFHSLDYYINYMNNHLTLIFITDLIITLEEVILGMIATLAITIFSIGLFLRLFFVTRRLGAMLIALGVCFYIVFPLTLLLVYSSFNTVAMFHGFSITDLEDDNVPFSQFNQNHDYIPTTELNRDAALLDTIYNMSRSLIDEDILTQASVELQKSQMIIGFLLFYNIIAILLALITSSVFTWETYKLLGSPMIATWYYV